MSATHLVEVNQYGFSPDTLDGIKANAYRALVKNFEVVNLKIVLAST